MKKLISFLFVFSLIFGCTKKNDSLKDPFYFKATIDGTKVEWIAPFVGFSSNNNNQFRPAMVTAASGGNYLYCAPGLDRLPQYSEGTAILDQYRGDPIDTNSISVDFIKSAVDFDVAGAPLKANFTNGPKTFGLYRLNCNEEPIDGILITYADANGKTWRSRAGNPADIAEQISLEDETRTQEYKKKWKVRFSCRLYDEAGNYIEVQNGEIYGPVWPI